MPQNRLDDPMQGAQMGVHLDVRGLCCGSARVGLLTAKRPDRAEEQSALARVPERTLILVKVECAAQN